MYHCEEARPQLRRSSTFVVKTVSGNWFSNGTNASCHFRRMQPVVKERLRDRIAALAAANCVDRARVTNESFSRWFARSLIGLLLMLSLGREVVAAGGVGDSRGIFSFVSLCGLLSIDPSYFSKGCRLVELISASPPKESSSFKRSMDLISPCFNSPNNIFSGSANRHAH